MPSPARFNGQPSQAVDVPFLCQQYVGVEPTLNDQYDRYKIKMQDRVQSRIDKNNAPDAMVKRYARLMSESSFPAVLVTEDNHTIDGNTRIKAHGERNDRYIKAWVLPVSWEGANAATREKLLLLSLALNSMNGLPLDTEELTNYAATLIRQGASDEEAVGRTGLPVTKISALRDKERATDRLRHVGIEVEVTDSDGNKTLVIPETSLRAFGKPNAMKLDDDMLTGLFGLTREAGLKGGAVNSLATSLNEQASADSKRERLARERTALQPQILANQGGHSLPMQCDWLRGVITKLLDKPISSFAETNPEKTVEYIELVGKGIERLHEISTLQQNPQPSASAPVGREATH